MMIANGCLEGPYLACLEEPTMLIEQMLEVSQQCASPEARAAPRATAEAKPLTALTWSTAGSGPPAPVRCRNGRLAGPGSLPPRLDGSLELIPDQSFKRSRTRTTSSATSGSRLTIGVDLRTGHDATGPARLKLGLHEHVEIATACNLLEAAVEIGAGALAVYLVKALIPYAHEPRL